MKKISTKIITAVVAVVLVVGIVLSGTSLVALYQVSNSSLDQLEDKLFEDYDILIQAQVSSMVTQLSGIHKMVESGELTLDEAKFIAANMVRDAKYGEGGYFWIDDYEGNNVVLLGRDDVEGSNRIDLQDTQGQYIIRDLIGIAQSGGGYYDYYFPKPGETESLAKRAYIMSFPPFEWTIGTGNYTDDIDAFISAERVQAQMGLRGMILLLMVITAGALVVAVVVAMVVGKRISMPIVKITELINITSELNIKDNPQYDFILKYKDETGDIAKAIGSLRAKLRDVVVGLQEDSSSLSRSSESLNNIAEEGKSGTIAVNDTALEFAKGATEQAEDAGRASESTGELGREIDESVNSALRLKDATEQVDASGKLGGERIGLTIFEMAKLPVSVVAIIKAKNRTMTMEKLIM